MFDEFHFKVWSILNNCVGSGLDMYMYSINDLCGYQSMALEHGAFN